MWENSNKYLQVRHTSTPCSLALLLLALAEQYIKSGEGLGSVRHIFHKFPFDQFEESSLAKIKSFITRNNIAIPTNWREPELLRHGSGYVLYALMDAVVAMLARRSGKPVNVENLAIRQQLGHKRLPQFVGNIDRQAPYRPEGKR